MKKRGYLTSLIVLYVLLIMSFFVVTTFKKASDHAQMKVLGPQEALEVKEYHFTRLKIKDKVAKAVEVESEGFSLPDVDMGDILVYVILTLGLYGGKRWIDWYFKKKEIILEHETDQEHSSGG